MCYLVVFRNVYRIAHIVFGEAAAAGSVDRHVARIAGLIPVSYSVYRYL